MPKFKKSLKARVEESDLKMPSNLHLQRGRGRGGLVVRQRNGARGLQDRNPTPPKPHLVWGMPQAKSYAVTKRPPAGGTREFGRGRGCQLRRRSCRLIAVQN
ncbi:hypothetical protein AVEN_272532-1 [Araneus ventricosus]|uniref:Uncharacterized protein n=1 Tax=Araneus ventricosus TaxID=182803 RepID=A0A4Y2E9E5_ARAVE|nr:hypothetical protein AVEN_272532-1 [Araneus ventricosus]